MGAMNAKAIREALNVTKRSFKTVNIPGLGEVRLKEMSGRQRDSIEEYVLRHTKKGPNGKPQPNTDGVRALTIILSVVDDKDAYVFSEMDMEMLAELPTRITDAMYEEIQKLNGLAGDVAVLLGEDSGNGVIDTSGSSSPKS